MEDSDVPEASQEFVRSPIASYDDQLFDGRDAEEQEAIDRLGLDPADVTSVLDFFKVSEDIKVAVIKYRDMAAHWMKRLITLETEGHTIDPQAKNDVDTYLVQNVELVSAIEECVDSLPIGLIDDNMIKNGAVELRVLLLRSAKTFGILRLAISPFVSEPEKKKNNELEAE